jgi:hypothetical protein
LGDRAGPARALDREARQPAGDAPGARTMTPRGGPSRQYELRLSGLAEPRVRGTVAAALGRLPGMPEPARLEEALAGPGCVMRLALSDAEAAALLRELYAAGMAPAAVMLRPVDPRGARGRTDAENAAFAVFAARGGRFAPTWSWTAFLFGPLWYLRRGLYAKGLILLVLSVWPFWTLQVTLLVSLVVLAYCGIAGKWDDYLWRVRGTQWW